MTTKYLTVREIAIELRVSRNTVYSWINSGQLRAIKFVTDTSKGTLRIPCDSYSKFLAKHETVASSEDF